MSRAPVKVALAAGSLVPTFGATTVLLGDPWLTAIAMSVGGGVIGLSCWVLFRHPYLEIRETVQEGSRTRCWRAGVERHSLPVRSRRESSNSDIARRGCRKSLVTPGTKLPWRLP